VSVILRIRNWQIWNRLDTALNVLRLFSYSHVQLRNFIKYLLVWDFTFSSECINDGYFLVSFEDTSCRLAFIISEFCIPKAFFDEHYPRHMSRTSLPDTPESEVISHLQKKVERFLGGSLIRPTCKCWSPSHLSRHWRKGASRVSIQAGLTCSSKRHCVVVSASRVPQTCCGIA